MKTIVFIMVLYFTVKIYRIIQKLSKMLFDSPSIRS